jgi:hypothetical protein
MFGKEVGADREGARMRGLRLEEWMDVGFARIGPAALAAIAGAVSGGGALASETRSFVIGPIYMPSVEVDAQSCPMKPKSAIQAFFDSLPPEEQAKYSGGDKARGLGMLMAKTYGFKRGPFDDTLTRQNIAERRAQSGFPEGKGAISSYPQRHLAYDLCTNPDDFPQLAAGHQDYLGKVGYGINLDGKVGKHDLVGVDGEKGVDNAWYQAVGCANIARSLGDPKVGDNVIVSRQIPTLIEVTGIDSDQDDDDVVVNVYASARALDLNAVGKALSWASFTPIPDPYFTASVKGRIVKGVLLTDPFDVNLRMQESIIDSSRDLRGARIQATMKPDGMEGGIYGYQTLASLEDAYAQTSTIGSDMISCPAEIKALRAHADGYKDPKTKRNSAISVALRFKAAPAFVVHDQAATTKVANK